METQTDTLLQELVEAPSYEEAVRVAVLRRDELSPDLLVLLLQAAYEGGQEEQVRLAGIGVYLAEYFNLAALGAVFRALSDANNPDLEA
ncbi:MAG: hypothetical protein ABUL49_01130, partial [bacterium]